MEGNQTCCLLICRNGRFITRMLAKVPGAIVLPITVETDPRLFLKKGEIVRPFITVTFRHVRNFSAAGFKIAVFEETAQAEFDPAGLQQTAMRSLEKDYDELNGKPTGEKP